MEFCKCICRNSATKEGDKALIAWQRLRDCLPLTEVRLDENKKRNRNMKNGLLSLTFIACLASSLAFADNPADAPLVTDDRNTATTRPQNCNGFKSQQHISKDESASFKRKQKNGWRDQHDAQSPLTDHRAILSSPVTTDK